MFRRTLAVKETISFSIYRQTPNFIEGAMNLKFIQLDDDAISIDKAVKLLNKHGYKSSVIQFESGIEKIVEDRIKQLEKNLNQLESNYKQLAKRVRGFFRMELPSGKLSLVDHFLTELSGYSLDAWENTPNYIKEIIHPDFLEYYQNQFQKLLTNQVPNILECIHCLFL